MEQRPRTIEELKQWYIDKNLPSESITRFFIGSNYKGAKAFGIYKDEVTDKYVVYKNKADGSRSIRYEGMDEAYAVNEIYQKLKSEIYNQKNNNPENYHRNTSYNNNRSYYSDQGIYIENDNDNYNYNYNYHRTRYRGRSIQLGSLRNIIIIYIILILLVLVCCSVNKRPKNGYYNYNDDYYYYQNGSWYIYDDEYDSWDHTIVSDTFKDDCYDYYSSSYYSYSYGIGDFEDSTYYKSSRSSSDYYDDSDYDYDDDYDWDWDSDYDWDSSSSWDSDYSDWDSDW